MIEGYMSVKEASEIWHITPRRIQVYCSEGRIDGAAKLGREWAIPITAKKPCDNRIISGRYKGWRNNKTDKKTRENIENGKNQDY